MYKETLWRIRATIFCNGNATMHSVYCLATCNCQQYNNIRRCAFLWRIPLAERNVGRSTCTVSDLLRSLNQILIFSAIFIEVSNIKFHTNPYNRSRADTWGQDGWTGGHDEINRHFSLRMRTCLKSISVPWNFVWGGGVQQIQLRTEDGENGDLGAVAP
jgi:hypothetical protein